MNDNYTDDFQASQSTPPSPPSWFDQAPWPDEVLDDFVVQETPLDDDAPQTKHPTHLLPVDSADLGGPDFGSPSQEVPSYQPNGSEFDLDALFSRAIITPAANPPSDYLFTRHTPHYWLDQYIQYSKERSPRGYSTLHEMSGLFALSAAVGGRVRISYARWHSTALYFIGCAHSTHYAKSTTANVARAVLDKAGLWWRFGPDMMTPQIMLSFLSDKQDNDNDNENDKKKKNVPSRQEARKYHEGQLAWIYDEFSQKLKSMMKDSGPFAEFHGILRKFNENPKSFEYATRAYGFEHISYPCLTLLGLTTPDELRQFGQSGGQLWTDGFFARFLMVGPSPSDKPKLTPPRKIPPVPLEVIKPLSQMNQWLGFRESYDDPLPIIYMEPPDEISNEFFQYELFLHDRCQESDLSASYKRIAVEHCPKIAALLAASDGYPNVEMRHAHRAIEIGERVRYGLDSLYKELTNYTKTERQKHQSKQEEKIINILKKATAPMTVAQIARKTGNSKKYRMSHQDVVSTLATLSDSGIATFDPKGNKQYWRLTPDSN